MLIAGEASGDLLAAELVEALRRELMERQVAYTPEMQPLRTGLAPRFFGAGGAHMKAAGVDIAYDLTRLSMIGVLGVLQHYLEFRRVFQQLLRTARSRQPDVVIGVDYGEFNLRFARAVRRAAKQGVFRNWKPKLVQFVSPQVWASRAWRADRIARNYDLVLSIFPFEKAWYAERVPELRVEFVGHPMVDRFPSPTPGATERRNDPPRVVLLPGSRLRELTFHMSVLLETLALMRKRIPALEATMVLPNDALLARARELGVPDSVRLQTGGLPDALRQADVAIAKTGTVTLECAFFGVPTVTLYKMSWRDYQIAKRLVKVNTVTMPNLLAGEPVFPEFIQHAATPENLAGAALDLLENPQRREQMRQRLARVTASLGPPGAVSRAAKAVADLLT